MPLVGTRRSRVDGWVVGMRPPRARPNGDDVAAPRGPLRKLRCGHVMRGLPGRYPPPCAARGPSEHVLFEWRVELGRLAALMGAAGARHRPAGARRLRQEPRDLRVPRCGGHRPRALRARIVARPPAGAVGRRTARGLASAAVARVRARRVDRCCSSGWPSCSSLAGAARPVASSPPRCWRLVGLGAHGARQGLPDVEPAAGGPARDGAGRVPRRCRRPATCSSTDGFEAAAAQRRGRARWC